MTVLATPLSKRFAFWCADYYLTNRVFYYCLLNWICADQYFHLIALVAEDKLGPRSSRQMTVWQSNRRYTYCLQMLSLSYVCSMCSRRRLWNTNNSIQKQDRPKYLHNIKRMLYASTEAAVQTLFDDSMSDNPLREIFLLVC